MFSEFKKYIESNHLFTNNDRLLVAASGGADSMVLIDLLLKGNYSFSVVHMNYGLRGTESEGDEQFLRDYCKKNQLQLFVQGVSVADYMQMYNVSLQEAARDLRYNWFEKIRMEHSFDYILTAHHRTDQVETILQRLVRGTGLSGLHGILPKSNRLVRPLLCTTAKEIRDFAQSNFIEFREDSSNHKEIYQRNLIRHQVLPVLKSINPSVERTFQQFSEHMVAVDQFYQEKILTEKNNYIVELDNDVKGIKIRELQKNFHAELLLFEFLKNYGVNNATVQQMLLSLSQNSGKMFYTATHQFLIDRDYLLVKELSRNEDYMVDLHEDTKWVEFFGKKIELQIVDFDSSVDLKNNNVLILDREKVEFPLAIRTVKTGDKWKPLGMKGTKLLSDHMIDKKMNRWDKENKGIVVDHTGKIVAVLGLGIHDDCKVTENTIGLVILKELNQPYQD